MSAVFLVDGADLVRIFTLIAVRYLAGAVLGTVVYNQYLGVIPGVQ